MKRAIIGLFFIISYANVIATDTNGQTEEIHIRDSHGKWVFKAPPKRIAVINWTLTEQLLELNVSPVAIADFQGFKATSPQTALPNVDDQIIDLGSRFAPDLAALRGANPDLILIGYSQRDLLRPLANIAPVMYFNNFSRRYQNDEKADERFLILAKLFKKTAYAQQKLNNRDEKLHKIKKNIDTYFDSNLPQLTIASIQKDKPWVFLENSMPFAVSKQLGFSSHLSQKATKFGTHSSSFKDLFSQNGCVFFINNDTDNDLAKAIPNTPPCTVQLNKTNTYGGAMSRLYIAESILAGIETLHLKQ